MSKHRLKARSKVGLVAAASLVAMTMAPMSAVFAASGPATSRLGGVDRMATAIQIAQQEYPNGPSSGTVIIASGDNANLIDSVTVAPLAKALGAPILLSQSATQLSSETASYLTSNHITKVILVGAAANPTLQAQLPAGVSVQQISGADRYATAAAIAQALEKAENVTSFSTVFVASGDDQNMSDALAAAPFAANMNAPVLLAAPNSSSLPSSEAGFITGSSSQTEYVVGAAVGYGLAAGGDTQKTVGSGSNDNYQNAVAIAQQFAPSNGYSIIDVANDSSTDVVNANGLVSFHLVDAITGGPLAAKQGAPIIFTNGSTVPSSVQSFLSSSAAKSATTVNVFGGSASIPDSTVSQITSAVTPTTSQAPTLGSISVSGQAFGAGTAVSPAVSNNGSPITVSASLQSANGNPIVGVDLSLSITGGTATVQQNGAPVAQNSSGQYEIATDSNGVASAQISEPGGTAASLILQYSAPYTVNGSQLQTGKAYVEFVNSNTAAISPAANQTFPVSTSSNPTAGLVPVTVTLPPVNGSEPANVPVNFTLYFTVPTGGTPSAGPFLASAQGGAIASPVFVETATSGNVTVNVYQETSVGYTDTNGQATVYVQSNQVSSNTSTSYTNGNLSVSGQYEANITATATDVNGTQTASTNVSWGQAGVPSTVHNAAATGYTLNPSSNTYNANVGTQVTFSAKAVDATGAAVPNATLIVVAGSTTNKGTDSYVQNGTITPFPEVSSNGSIAGNPPASSSYGEVITTDSAGNFSFTVTNTSANTNEYEVYSVSNGLIQSSIWGPLTVSWQQTNTLTTIGVAGVPNVSHKVSNATGIQGSANNPNLTLVYFEGFAGSTPFPMTNGSSVSYTVTVNNSGTINAVYGFTGSGISMGNGSGVKTVNVSVQQVGSSSYTITANSNLIGTFSSPVVGLGLYDKNAETDTVTISQGSITGTAQVQFVAGAPAELGTSPTPSVVINPGGSNNVTILVEDANGDPVPSQQVTITNAVYSSNTAQNLWISAVNGVALTGTLNINGQTTSNAPTPIPLWANAPQLGYSSVTATGNIAGWSNSNGAGNTITVMTTANGTFTLTIQAGDIQYTAPGGSGGFDQIGYDSNVPGSGQILYVSYVTSPSFAISLQGTSDQNTVASISF